MGEGAGRGGGKKEGRGLGRRPPTTPFPTPTPILRSQQRRRLGRPRALWEHFWHNKTPPRAVCVRVRARDAAAFGAKRIFWHRESNSGVFWTRRLTSILSRPTGPRLLLTMLARAMHAITEGSWEWRGPGRGTVSATSHFGGRNGFRGEAPRATSFPFTCIARAARAHGSPKVAATHRSASAHPGLRSEGGPRTRKAEGRR